MLIFGDYKMIPSIQNKIEDLNILNFTSLKEGIEKVFLIPPFQLQFFDERTFDINYFNWIFQDDTFFMELMKIMIPLYFGNNVFIAVTNENNMYDYLTESLQKLIQQRYGYISNIIYCEEDLDTLVEGSFHIMGISNLDIDKERFEILYSKMNGLI